MNRHVNAIAGRLSLRAPQRHSLEILDRVTEIAPPRKGNDVASALEVIRSEYPTVIDFERDFVSLCFALATGVGKTRLMGAFVSYLHLAHGINNFFVLSPNLTIYNKLIADFSERTSSKYVFTGISEFAVDAPEIITGDNYEDKAGSLFDQTLRCKVNIFNIAKINSEVRGGKSPRIKRLREYIGESYFEYLAALPDLVLIMDESHRYRASAGVRAINELKPVLGLELTATPFTEGPKGAVPFKNVIYDYPLAKAMEDGFVKEPAVATQKNFDPKRFSASEIEKIKLEDGIRLHEDVKVRLETYARETEQAIVKPFVLVIARDITHANELVELVRSESFFEGRYKEKVIQVDSSKTGAAEEEMIEHLLKVEHTDEPTEIVIHVNMLKEGWDVTNLYTIVPLRAANARILIEQSIGRGLRLPYGKRTGVSAVDRLSIVAHDKFQEIIDEANRGDSPIRLQKLILEPPSQHQRLATVVSQAGILAQIGGQSLESSSTTITESGPVAKSVFSTDAEQKVAKITLEVINQYERLPSSSQLLGKNIQKEIIARVKEEVVPSQGELAGVADEVDVAAVVAKTTELVVRQTIDIPRILVVPTGEVTSGFHSFKLDPGSIHYQPVERDILIQHLRTHKQETLTAIGSGQTELRLEDYLVRALIDFDDISYDDHADLLYDLAAQTVEHLRTYLKDERDVVNVLQYYQRQLAEFIHSQMQAHHWEKASGHEVVVSKGFTALKPLAFTAPADEAIHNFRHPVKDKTKIAQMVFGGFTKCLYPVQKFQADTERVLAIILDRDTEKWFRPGRGQFQIFYKLGADQREYQPDFVAETKDSIYMLEPKMKKDMDDQEVLSKKESAVTWCKHASDHASKNGGKPWKYLLIPHDSIAENMTLRGLAAQFSNRS